MNTASYATSTLERSRRSTWPLCALSLAIIACNTSLGPLWLRAFCQLTAEGSSSFYHGNASPSHQMLIIPHINPKMEWNLLDPYFALP